MIYPTVDVVNLKRKLYQRRKDFKKFENINEERQELLRSHISFLKENYEKLDLYIKTLQLVVLDYKRDYTYDERLFCLIESCDPDLNYLKTFNRFGNPKKGEIEYDQYINEMKSIAGFADDNLRKYEYFYFKNIVYKNFQKENQQENQKKLSRTIR